MIAAEQIRAARAIVEWSQADLAEAAGVSRPTIKRMENQGPGNSSAANVDAVQKVLEAAGIVFIEANGMGAGVRLGKNSLSWLHDKFRAWNTPIHAVEVFLPDKHRIVFGLVHLGDKPPAVGLIRLPLPQSSPLELQFESCAKAISETDLLPFKTNKVEWYVYHPKEITRISEVCHKVVMGKKETSFDAPSDTVLQSLRTAVQNIDWGAFKPPSDSGLGVHFEDEAK